MEKCRHVYANVIETVSYKSYKKGSKKLAYVFRNAEAQNIKLVSVKKRECKHCKAKMKYVEMRYPYFKALLENLEQLKSHVDTYRNRILNARKRYSSIKSQCDELRNGKADIREELNMLDNICSEQNDYIEELECELGKTINLKQQIESNYSDILAELEDSK